MGNGFKIGGGKQNITRNQAAAVQINSSRHEQAAVTELLVLLGMAQRELTKLSVSESFREEAKNEVRSAQLEARKKKPDKKKIVAELKNAIEILGRIPNTVTAAVRADDLLSKGLEVCVDLIL